MDEKRGPHRCAILLTASASPTGGGRSPMRRYRSPMFVAFYLITGAIPASKRAFTLAAPR